MPACVLLSSVAENNRDDNTLRFHVFIDESVGDNERCKINTTANKYGIHVNFYLIDNLSSGSNIHTLRDSS